jgi:hypothetical protein
MTPVPRKISEFNTKEAIADTDLVTIVDPAISNPSLKNKKITWLTLKNAIISAISGLFATTDYVDSAVATSIPDSEKGMPDGVATLDANGILTPAQVPEDDTILAYQALGSSVKAQVVGLGIDRITTTGTMSPGILSLTAVYLKKPSTITGVRWFQAVQGNYTADDYNGVGLYSYSGGTLTLEASSTDDGDIWKGANDTWQNKDFSSPYVASAGIYYVGLLLNRSAHVTLPGIGVTSSSRAGTPPFDFTNSAFIHATKSSQTSLPATLSASTANVANIQRYVAIY